MKLWKVATDLAEKIAKGPFGGELTDGERRAAEEVLSKTARTATRGMMYDVLLAAGSAVPCACEADELDECRSPGCVGVQVDDVDTFLVRVDLGDGDLVGCDPVTLRRVRREPDAWIVWRAATCQAMTVGYRGGGGFAVPGEKWRTHPSGPELLEDHAFPTISAALDDFCRLGGWRTWQAYPDRAESPRPEDLELRAVVGVHLSDLDGA